MADLTPFYVNPKGNPFSIAGKLLRAEFANWQNFFQPIELDAMQQISWNNPTILNEAVGEAKEAATGQFGTMEGILQRQNRALGIEAKGQEATTSKRLLDIDKSLAIASAANQARSNVRSADDQLLFGVAANPNISRMT